MRNIILFINNILLILFIFDLFLRITFSTRKIFLPSHKKITKLKTESLILLCYFLSISLIFINSLEALIIGITILIMLKILELNKENTIFLKKIALLLCIGGSIVTLIISTISIFQYGIYSLRQSLLVVFNIASSFTKGIIDIFVAFIIIFFFINIISNIKH